LLARAERCFTSSRPRPREQPVMSIFDILASSSEDCLQVGRRCDLINVTSSDPQFWKLGGFLRSPPFLLFLD
jgi:hypothetical protein